jgi:hypothetical protein
MPDADSGKFSTYPDHGPRPVKQWHGKGKKKKKKDMDERMARIQEAQQELMARRSEMTPEGPRVDINPWNKS